MKIAGKHVRGGWSKPIVKVENAPKYVKDFILQHFDTLPEWLYIVKENDFGKPNGYTVVIDGVAHHVVGK